MKVLLERFEVVKTIGQGHYGKILLAIDLQNDNQPVAVKIINLPNENLTECNSDETEEVIAVELSNEQLNAIEKQESIMRSIRKEMEALQKCNDHEFVVELLDVIEYEEQNQILIVMEYCDHGDLFDFIDKHGRLKEKDVRRWFNQIVKAVHYIHSNGVVHRDLKPENILLTSRSKQQEDYNQVAGEEPQNLYCRIVDFGLCGLVKKKNKQQMFNSYVGTENYCCPELLQGKSYDGFKADSWSLGCILYTMLVGIYPFDSDTMFELIQKITQCKYEIPNFISSDARDLIEKILVVDPDKRLSIDAILQHQFCSFQQ